jgi:hypothetical protein
MVWSKLQLLQLSDADTLKMDVCSISFGESISNIFLCAASGNLNMNTLTNKCVCQGGNSINDSKFYIHSVKLK